MDATKIINDLGLTKISVTSEKDMGNYKLVKIFGGFNGSGEWPLYIRQIQEIVEAFKECWVIDLNTDLADDVWYLRLGIRDDSRTVSQK